MNEIDLLLFTEDFGRVADSDGDGILDDGDLSNVVGDSYCIAGATVNCDDNCLNTDNPDQTDSDSDGIGDFW